MKRIFTISVAAVMALLMVLSLTACGNFNTRLLQAYKCRSKRYEL